MAEPQENDVSIFATQGPLVSGAKAIASGVENLTGETDLYEKTKVKTEDALDQLGGFSRLIQKGAEFDDTKSGITVDPFKVNKVFSYDEIFKRYENEKDFDPTKTKGKLFEDENIRSFVTKDGKVFDVSNATYKEKINMLDQLPIAKLSKYNERGEWTNDIDLNTFTGDSLRTNIEEKIQSEVDRDGSALFFSRTNPLTGVSNPLNFRDYQTKYTEKGDAYPSLGNSAGVEAKNLYEDLTVKFPDLPEKTKFALINRQVYGRTSTNSRLPQEGESGRTTTTTEKVVTLIQDLPRAYADLAVTITGFAGEYAVGSTAGFIYDMGVVQSGVSNFVKSVTGDYVDLETVLPDGNGQGFSAFPNIFSEKGRDQARKMLGPDAIEDFRLRLAADDIKVPADVANYVLHHGRNVAEKLLINVPQFLAEGALIAKLGKKKARETAESLKKWVNENPSKKFLSEEEMVNQWLASTNKAHPVFQGISDYIKKTRLKDGSQILETELPLAKRGLVMDAKAGVKEANTKYLDAIAERKMEILAFQKKNPNASVPTLFSEKVLRAKALKEAQMVKLRMSERASEAPQYIRDMYRDTANFAIAASVVGQTLQESDLPPEVAYLGGLGVLMGYSFISNVSPRGIPILGRLGLDVYLDNVNHMDKYSQTNNIFKYINELDKKTKEGFFEGFDGTNDFMTYLQNPQFAKLSPGKQRLAKELAAKLNSLDPAVREQVLANVQMYRELKDELVGQVGIDEDLLAESFGQMSGLSFFSALEDSYLYSMAEKNVFDKSTSKILAEMQNTRANLTQQLKEKLNKILLVKESSKDNPAIMKLASSLQKAIAASEETTMDLQGVGNAVISSKVVALRSLLNGNADADVQKAIEIDYGDIGGLASSIINDITRKHTKFDITDTKQLRADLVKLENEVETKFLQNVDAFDQTLLDEAHVLPNITYGKAKRSDGDKVKFQVSSADMGKYGNENSALARFAMIKKQFAQAQAQIPFRQFDEKYQNRLGTDASVLATKLYNDIVRTTRDKATDKLINKELLHSDNRSMFNIFDDAAEKTLLAAEENGLASIQSYKEKIAEVEGVTENSISHLDIWSYIKRENPELGEKLGLTLNIAETQTLNQALGSKAFLLNKSDPERGRLYTEYRNEADQLYDNVIDVNGPISEAKAKELRAELTAMNQGYRNNYTSVWRASDSEAANLTNVDRVSNLDNAETPGGFQWSDSGNPNTWFDLAKISKMDDQQVALKGQTLTRMFGKQKADGSGFFVDPKSDTFAFLGRVAKVKFLRQLGELQKTHTDPKILRQEIDKLERSTLNLFKSDPSKKLTETTSAFNAEDVYDMKLSLPSRINANKEVALKAEQQLAELKKIETRDKIVVTKAIETQKNNTRILKGLADTSNTNEGFFNIVVANANGQTNFKSMRDSVVSSGQMTTKEFNAAAREIIGDYVSGKTIQPSGAKIVTRAADKKGKKGNILQVVDDVDLDADTLVDIFNNKVHMKNIQDLGLMSDKHIKNLQSVAKFMSRRKAIHKQRQSIRFTGRPTGLSIESYISRFYSISRGVVSPKYVGTEALIQNLRMKQHNMLKAMMGDPDIAEIMTDLIVNGEKFTEAREVRLKELLIQMSVKANVQAQAGGSLFENTQRDSRLYPNIKKPNTTRSN